MSARSPETRLTELLRQGDPLIDDPGSSSDHEALMRRQILAQVPGPLPRRRVHLSPALSVAMLLALALALAWWPSSSHESRLVPSPTGETTLTRQAPEALPGIQKAGNALETRKIQFETPGGTLVVWVLNPNFPS